LVTLLLALTDQFERRLGVAANQALELLPRLRGDYERAYYKGIICERRAKARLHDGGPGVAAAAYEWLCEAMSWYEKAEAICPPGNDDATLRWNACARLIMSNSQLRPSSEEWVEPPLE
jgi:hypothetical protein